MLVLVPLAWSVASREPVEEVDTLKTRVIPRLVDWVSEERSCSKIPDSVVLKGTPTYNVWRIANASAIDPRGGNMACSLSGDAASSMVLLPADRIEEHSSSSSFGWLGRTAQGFPP